MSFPLPAPVDDPAARLGTILRGKWRLERVLGVGGMATVYEAVHRNGLRGAVKMLHHDLARNPGMVERFLREGYMANKVGHVGVVRVLDDDTSEDGTAFLVMELLEGDALIDLAEANGGRLPLQDVLGYAHQLLDVLHAAHQAGVVHRDIKPDNLFLTRTGVLKVLDFGLARAFDGETRRISVTQSGVVMGTPAYMSPEQARGRWNLVDAQSDLWSVGATMFALLAGEPVHAGESTPNEVMAATFTKPARTLLSVAPDTPLEVVTLVDKALALSKSERWASAGAMREAVLDAYEALYGERPPTPLDEMRPLSFSGELTLTASGTRSSLPPDVVRPLSTRSLFPEKTLSPVDTLVSVPRPKRRRLWFALGLVPSAVLVALLVFPRSPRRTQASASVVPPPQEIQPTIPEPPAPTVPEPKAVSVPEPPPVSANSTKGPKRPLHNVAKPKPVAAPGVPTPRVPDLYERRN